MSSKFVRKNTFHKNNTQLQKDFLGKEEGPINLIEFRRDKLIVNEEALKILKEIKENIIIVSIFGKERTGKSYLMNCILDSDERHTVNQGFKMSCQSNPSPRGICIWNTPISKSNSNEKIIFCDSNGIYCENVYEQVSGSKLLALILLISSLFIYNTMNDITSNSLNDLELLLHLDDSIHINHNGNSEISEACPKFMWAVRDFDLKKLSPKNEKIMTSDEYMEHCLKERFGGANKDEINMIKVNFIRYFQQRECITFPRPLDEDKDLIILRKAQVNELDDNFQKELRQLKNKIFKLSKIKMINGKILNGPMVAYLISRFVKEINNDNIPNVNVILKELILLDMDNSYNLAKKVYKEKLQNLRKEEINVDIKEIYSIKYSAMKEFMKILEKYPDITTNDIYLNEYNMRKEKLDKEIENLLSQELGELISNNSCKKILNEKENYKKYKNSSEFVEEYLNELFEVKINTNHSVLNKKDFENFIKNDLHKTKDIINYMENNHEIYLPKKETIDEQKLKSMEFNDDAYDQKNYENLKKELKNTEKYALELIGKFTKLLEARDNLVSKFKNKHIRHNWKSFSSKLVNNIYNNEDEICQLSSEEKQADKCNCNTNPNSICIIF